MKSTAQEVKIKLFNHHDDQVMMHLNKVDSLGDAILFILHKNYQRGNKNIGKVALKNEVNHYYGGEAIKDIKVIRDKINELRNEKALIVSRGGKGGGYRKATGWQDVNNCTKSLFHSQAMSLLSTEKAMKQGAQEEYGVEQYSLEMQNGSTIEIMDAVDPDPFIGMEDIQPVLLNPEESVIGPITLGARCPTCDGVLALGSKCLNKRCANYAYREQ